MGCGIRGFLVLFLLFLSCASPAGAAPEFEILDLGPGEAGAINDKGWVVGYDALQPSDRAGFIWDSTQGRRTIPRYPNSVTQSIQTPHGIDNEGTVLIAINNTPHQRRGRPASRHEYDLDGVLWSESRGFFRPPPLPVEDARVAKMNSRGEMIAGRQGELTLLITATGTVDLKTKHPNLLSASYLNNKGEWVGWLDSREMVSNSDRVNSLIEGHFKKGWFAVDLSDGGDLLVRFPNPTNPRTTSAAILKSDGKILELESPPSMDIRPRRINNRGQVIGGALPLSFSEWLEDLGLGIDETWFRKWASTLDRETEFMACVWIDGEFFNLHKQLPWGSGWDRLETADDINNQGQIVGTGFKDGKSHVYLANPVVE